MKLEIRGNNTFFKFIPETKEDVKELFKQIGGRAKGEIRLKWGDVDIAFTLSEMTAALDGWNLLLIDTSEKIDGDWPIIGHINLRSLEPDNFSEIAAWGKSKNSIESITIENNRDYFIFNFKEPITIADIEDEDFACGGKKRINHFNNRAKGYLTRK